MLEIALSTLKFTQEYAGALGILIAALGIFGAFTKWIWERLPQREQNPRIKPTFISVFGRYQLENMNIYAPDGHGNFIGRTINDIPERDTYFTVEPVVKNLVYKVVPTRPDDRMIVFLRLSPNGPRRMINFNIVS